MGDELGTEFSAACNKLRRVLQEKTGDGRLRDLAAMIIHAAEGSDRVTSRLAA
jgi:hypothetical protein